jgi:TonB-linked SusC/RagA family outer membrane protein
MRQRLLLFLAFSTFLCTCVSAQKSVSGTVTGDGEPLIGVTVRTANSATGTITDLDGRYEISIPAGSDSLFFSYTGFQAIALAVGNQTRIDVVLGESSEMLSEVVVIGYGVQRKDDLTGAVSVVTAENLVDVPTQSLGQSLQGKVAGLRIIPASGTPGADAVFQIRGVGTFVDASPLFVVDGMIVDDISFVNPRDVENVSVLKDASATAIYGARGANGVIIVTTKQGSGVGEGKITFSAFTGSQEVIKTLDLANASEYANLLNQADINDGRPPRFADPDSFGEGTDWQDEVFQSAPIQSLQLGFSGGTDKSSFNMSANYFRQDGIITGSAFDRFTARINTSRSVKPWLKIGTNLSLVLNNSDNINSGGILLGAYRTSPVVAPRDSTGNFGNTAAVSNTGNPLATIEFANSKSQSYRAVGNAYAEAKLGAGFSVRTSFGLDFNYNRNKNFTPVFFVSPEQQNEESVISVFNAYERNWLWENTLNYNRDFGAHHIDGLVGITSQDNYGEFINGSRRRLNGDEESFYFLNSGDPLSATNGSGPSGGDWGMVSYLGRLNYVYDQRYLVTISGRVDGSSRFGANNRYGFFPSVGLGWNVSREDFWNTDGLVNRLKLRASWGQTGNDRIGDFRYTALVSPNINTVFGPDEILLPGATLLDLANPDLRWEETTQLDFGVELGLLDDRLQVEADFYRRVADGVLFAAPIPQFIGANAPTRNVASILNRGVDLQLVWQDRVGSLNYSIGTNMSFVNNEILAVDGMLSEILSGGLGVGGQLGTRSRAGLEAGSFYGYELDGIFQNEEELGQFAQLGNQQPGDFRFRDQDGDGIITADGDKVLLGSPIPDMILGVNGSVGFKGFDLTFDFTGQFGNELVNAKKMARFGAYNYESEFVNAWNGEGTSNTIPRITLAGQNFETLSSRYIEDGSYIRLRNLTFGYSLPAVVTDKLRMQSLRLYVNGTNLWTATEYTGYNPEIIGGVFSSGIDQGSVYPVARAVTFGLDVTF